MSFSDTPTFRDQGGCALSVLTASLATAVVAAILGATEGIGEAVMAFVIAFIVSLVVIAFSALLIGLPLTRLLESNGLERAWTYPVAGLVFGAVVLYLLLEAIGMPRGWSLDDAPTLLIGALPGFICGAAWWWFERRHAQDPEPGDPPGRGR